MKGMESSLGSQLQCLKFNQLKVSLLEGLYHVTHYHRNDLKNGLFPFLVRSSICLFQSSVSPRSWDLDYVLVFQICPESAVLLVSAIAFRMLGASLLNSRHLFSPFLRKRRIYWGWREIWFLLQALCSSEQATWIEQKRRGRGCQTRRFAAAR